MCLYIVYYLQLRIRMKNELLRIPIRYAPKTISAHDTQRQARMLLRSRKLYKKGQYYTRKKLASYHNRPSKHIIKARKIYGVETIAPTPELAAKTGCSISALDQIVKKGEGAYFSSGSRPNQTAQSWGYARLASSLTAGKSAAVDYSILQKGCKPTSRAFRMAQSSRRKYHFGQSSAKRRSIHLRG
jgi:hypothetical protein